MGGSITLGHGGAGFGRVRPTVWAAKVLKSDGTKFLCPAVLHHHYPPISHRLRTCPPRRRGSSGWAWCWVSCADALSFGGTGSRPSPGTRERVHASRGASLMHPTGLGVVSGGGTSRSWVPTFVGRSGARNWSWWVGFLGSRFCGNDDGGGHASRGASLMRPTGW
jgi:hypothetical protein